MLESQGQRLKYGGFISFKVSAWFCWLGQKTSVMTLGPLAKAVAVSSPLMSASSRVVLGTVCQQHANDPWELPGFRPPFCWPQSYISKSHEYGVKNQIDK